MRKESSVGSIIDRNNRLKYKRVERKNRKNEALHVPMNDLQKIVTYIQQSNEISRKRLLEKIVLNFLLFYGLSSSQIVGITTQDIKKAKELEGDRYLIEIRKGRLMSNVFITEIIITKSLYFLLVEYYCKLGGSIKLHHIYRSLQVVSNRLSLSIRLTVSSIRKTYVDNYVASSLVEYYESMSFGHYETIENIDKEI